MEFEGKVAVVTGSGHGIGAAIAKRFAAEGAKVLVTDIDEEAVQQVEKFLILTNPNDAQALADKAEDFDAWLDTKFTSFENLVGTLT